MQAIGIGSGAEFKIIFKPAAAAVENEIGSRINILIAYLAVKGNVGDPCGPVLSAVIIDDATSG